jgi:hypothetical protein
VWRRLAQSMSSPADARTHSQLVWAGPARSGAASSVSNETALSARSPNIFVAAPAQDRPSRSERHVVMRQGRPPIIMGVWARAVDQAAMLLSLISAGSGSRRGPTSGTAWPSHCKLPAWFGQNLNVWIDVLFGGRISEALDDHPVLVIRADRSGLFCRRKPRWGSLHGGV